MDSSMKALIGSIAMLLLLASCDRTGREWQAAQQASTVEAYQEFLVAHPDSQFATEARTQVERIRWEAAVKVNSLESYEAFLANHPTGRFSVDARARLLSAQELRDWGTAAKLNRLDALEEFLRKWPNGPNAVTARHGLESLRHLEEANKLIDMRIVEWFHARTLFIDPRNPPPLDLNSRLAELLQSSPLKKASEVSAYGVFMNNRIVPEELTLTVPTSGDAKAQLKISRGKGVRFQPEEPLGPFHFENDWASPYEMEVPGFANVTLRTGEVSLADGDIRVTNGTAARVESEALGNGEYTFNDGRWKDLEPGEVAQTTSESTTVKHSTSGGFLEEQANADGAVRTDSGLIYISLKDGAGTSPKATDTVKVHYLGTLPDGTVFDSSVAPSAPATFPLSRVIPCWTEGVQRMKVGGKSKLVCPPTLAYGDRGAPPGIPPKAVLVFEIELLGVERKQTR